MAADSRPKISVCIATWNGEAYIEAQLTSILKQLGSSDEVIIVDDASQDSTRARIRALGDSRICLTEHTTNMGVQRAFQDALIRATGEIIFLSDQDDIWLQNKVASAVELFANHPKLNVVVSDAMLIDEAGKLLSSSYYQTRGGFRVGVLANIFRCKYLGCVMVMRRQVLRTALPFPRSPNVLHDLWIGITN